MTTLTPRLEARGVHFYYGDHRVLHDLNLAITPGRLTAIVGANGSGKSTLLRALARLLRPSSGEILLDGTPLTSLSSRHIAGRLAFLPQSPIAPEGIAVADLVGRGRSPHQRLFARWSAHGAEVVADALAATGIAELADRSVDELSGGQRQRVWIAMALAQATETLLLDEPTTFLDIAHQVDVLDLLTDLGAQSKTIVMVLHDLSLAARYADELVAVRDGLVVAQGAPSDVVTTELVRDVFGLDSEVIPDPITHSPLILPRGRHHVRIQ